MTTGGPADQHGNGYPAFQGDQSPYYGQQSDGYQQGFRERLFRWGYSAPERSPWRRWLWQRRAAGVLLVVGGILAAVLLHSVRRRRRSCRDSRHESFNNLHWLIQVAEGFAVYGAGCARHTVVSLLLLPDTIHDGY